MKGYILPEHVIMDFEFMDMALEETHFHQNYELFYMLEGEACLSMGSDTWQLGKDDFVLINSNKKHSYEAAGPVLIACIHINYYELCRYLDSSQVFFWCNSTVEKSETYTEIRKTVLKIINHYFDKKGLGKIYLNSLYYQLLFELVNNFRIASDDSRYENVLWSAQERRIGDILNYINGNYRDKITLGDLAGRLYLSEAYLSKYIKKKFGMNFMEYVNNVRLYHAVDELLSTDKSIMRVAMDNGFPNVNSFNLTFKSAYHMTPSAYVESMTSAAAMQHHELERPVVQKVRGYIENHYLPQAEQGAADADYVVVDAQLSAPYVKNWNYLINVGTARDLLRSELRDHVLALKRLLGFSYMRFWDIYAPEMFLIVDASKGSYNFSKLDAVFDFLQENHIAPLVELGAKPEQLIVTLEKYMVYEERQNPFENSGQFGIFLDAFLTHYVDRYGIEAVEQWQFELWWDEHSSVADYLDYFKAAMDRIRSWSPRILLGGCGINRSKREAVFQQFVEQWESYCPLPDFFSVYCYHYIPYPEGEVKKWSRSRDRKYLYNYLRTVREQMDDAGFHPKRLYVTEWNSTISSRNVMNDTCHKGAYIMKNLIENIGHADAVAYWTAFDLFSEHFDSFKLLNGGGGLLSKDGICKPAWYAYDFMHSLDKYLLGRSDHSMITTDDHDSYTIACHNYKHFNFKYYMKTEDEIDIACEDQLFEDYEKRQLKFQIKNVKNGMYHIKIRSVDTDNGSVVNEWVRMGRMEYLRSEDIEYLKRICTPHIYMRELQVESGILNFETNLLANEIQVIRIQLVRGRR